MYCSRPVTVNAKNYFFTNSFSAPSVLLIYVSYDFVISRFYLFFFLRYPTKQLTFKGEWEIKLALFCTRQIVSSPKTFYGSSLQKILLFLCVYIQCSSKLVFMLYKKFLIKGIGNNYLLFPPKIISATQQIKII